jgi:hypothetical protein
MASSSSRIDLTKRKRGITPDALVDMQSKHAAKTDGERNVTFVITKAQAEKLYTEVVEKYEARPWMPRVGFWTRWDRLRFDIKS